jgi:hypothetical protein
MKIYKKLIPIFLAVFISLVIVTVVFIKRRPHKLRTSYFEKKWQDLQKLCSNKITWSNAIINADKLLDEALKKKKYSGKSMGERLVSAQRDFKDNDSVWFGHKLKNKIDTEPSHKLRQKEVKNALLGIKRALKDLGAFKNDSK